MKIRGKLLIHIYDEAIPENIDISEIVGYLEEKLGAIIIDLRKNLISSGNLESLALEFAEAKVKDTNSKDQPLPFPGEIEYEKKRLSRTRKRLIGIVYDGFMIQEIYSRLIPKGERNLRHCHIILTPDLVGTWNDGDRRYHARVGIYGFPSIISATGVVEAPARPREYYLKKNLGNDPLTLKEEFKGRFIDYDDSRLAEVMKGYCMQALFYHLTGDPFCKDKGCRLFNAHWQEELIKAQLGADYEFCQHHQKILDSLLDSET